MKENVSIIWNDFKEILSILPWVVVGCVFFFIGILSCIWFS